MVASVASLIAVGLDRFERVTAGFFILIGGAAPWLTLHYIHSGFSGDPLSLWLGVFGSPPLFVLALILYSSGKRAEGRSGVTIASAVGLCAGAAFSAVLFALLSGPTA